MFFVTGTTPNESEMDCILKFGTIISGLSAKTFVCIGKLMVYTLFPNWTRNYSSWLKNVVYIRFLDYIHMAKDNNTIGLNTKIKQFNLIEVSSKCSITQMITPFIKKTYLWWRNKRKPYCQDTRVDTFHVIFTKAIALLLIWQCRNFAFWPMSLLYLLYK